VTQSTHKTCAALSQGSVALFNDEKLLPRFYETVNNLGFVSTSFSYVILASVVMGVLQLHDHGRDLLDRALNLAGEVRRQINEIEGLACFGAEARQDGFIGFDPLRVTVDVSRLGLTGFAVEQRLIDEFRIYPEMATLRHVLFLFTMADRAPGSCRVIAALHQLAQRCRLITPRPVLPPPPAPPQALPPRPVFYHRCKRRLPVGHSLGSISAETIACYPPGSAVIVAGETVTVEVLEFLTEIRRRGGVLKGASDPTFKTIQIIE
jgi:ornithine decarboxylase